MLSPMHHPGGLGFLLVIGIVWVAGTAVLFPQKCVETVAPTKRELQKTRIIGLLILAVAIALIYFDFR